VRTEKAAKAHRLATYQVSQDYFSTPPSPYTEHPRAAKAVKAVIRPLLLFHTPSSSSSKVGKQARERDSRGKITALTAHTARRRREKTPGRSGWGINSRRAAPGVYS